MSTVTESACVRFRRKNGKIVDLTPSEFQERFGVEFADSLLFDANLRRCVPSLAEPCALPDESRRTKFELTVARILARREFGHRMKRQYLTWLYGEQIKACQTAPTFIAKVSKKVGYGLYAAEDIEPGKYVGEYTGMVLRPKDGADNGYRMAYFYPLSSCIDAAAHGNGTRFINYSGERPNVVPLGIYVDGEMRMAFLTMTFVPKGQQLLYNYGKGYWSKRGTPIELKD